MCGQLSFDFIDKIIHEMTTKCFIIVGFNNLVATAESYNHNVGHYVPGEFTSSLQYLQKKDLYRLL